MLARAIAEFLGSLRSEREFDVPFVALLHSLGFTSVHCLHGLYEFGKDFIAKREENGTTIQYAIQTKHGDIDSTSWEREAHPQAEQMFYADTAHPDFDRNLERQVLVVCTGELRGKAPVLAQEYKEYCAKRDLRFGVWTRNNLIELIAAPACIGERTDWPSLGRALSEMQSGDKSLFDMELITRSWAATSGSDELWQSVMEASLLKHELATRNLRFHGYHVTLGLVRAVCVQEAKGTLTDAEVVELLGLLTSDLEQYGLETLSWFSRISEDERREAFLSDGHNELIKYGARLLLFAEAVSMLTFLPSTLDDQQQELCHDLLDFCIRVPVCARPLSDNYAVSVLTVATAAHHLSIDPSTWLRGIVSWLRDSYRAGNVGLAPVRASPLEEMWRTMGKSVLPDEVQRREESSLASAVLDACSILGKPELYAEAQATFGTSGIIPHRLVPVGSPDDLTVGTSGCVTAYQGDYATSWQGQDGWRNSALHERAAVKRPFDNRGAHWVGVALGLLLRDRWWLGSLKSLSDAGRG